MTTTTTKLQRPNVYILKRDTDYFAIGRDRRALIRAIIRRRRISPYPYRPAVHAPFSPLGPLDANAEIISRQYPPGYKVGKTYATIQGCTWSNVKSIYCRSGVSERRGDRRGSVTMAGEKRINIWGMSRARRYYRGYHY